MVPILIGRIQTRIFLLAVVGSAVTALRRCRCCPVQAPFSDRTALRSSSWRRSPCSAIGWELLYHLLMQFRWEKDWPSLFGLLTGVPEAVLLWLLVRAGAVPLLGAAPPGWAFAAHFAAVWFAVWLVANGPMRVPFLRWRFRGGRLV